MTRPLVRRDDLTLESVRAFRPDYIFLVHWSWPVPEEILETCPCVGFHMTDLPYGRGGSPLQNLLVRGIYETQLTAFKLSEEMDAGPVYMKRPLSLQGSAGEIYERASALAFEMIDEIIERSPAPTAQKGEVVEFRRRTPAESEIPAGLTIRELYDFVRMLDADGYPAAFLTRDGYRYEFTGAILNDDFLRAQVRITPLNRRSE